MLQNLSTKKIFLASQSPRRKELLRGLDLPFEIKLKPVEETYPETLAPENIPVFLAEKKMAAFAEEIAENEIYITSDTIVIQDGVVLEKPKSIEEAKAMLEHLSDSSHIVITGVCIQSTEKKISFSDETLVDFMPLSTEEIDYYIAKYKPFDKAGGYGVQEWIGYIGIARLEGSYYNVMGLPVHLVYDALKSF
jgi:septum formation protein